MGSSCEIDRCSIDSMDPFGAAPFDSSIFAHVNSGAHNRFVRLLEISHIKELILLFPFSVKLKFRGRTGSKVSRSG